MLKEIRKRRKITRGTMAKKGGILGGNQEMEEKNENVGNVRL